MISSFNSETFFSDCIIGREIADQCQTSPTEADCALQRGERGMALSTAAAVQRDPDFKAKAEAAILRQLDACGPTPGEFLVEVARAYVQVKDGRAFGSIFKSLLKRGEIVCLRSDLPRTKGNGTAGGRLYARGVPA